MAVHAHFFPENLGFPAGGSLDYAADYFCAGGFVNREQEIDYYIRSQNESLRFALREQARQQMGALLKRIEMNTSVMLRDKEEELKRAVKKTMELEIFLRKLETENQVWQRIAQENEAIAISLNKTLDQVREKAENCCENDAESCCEMNREENGEEEEEEQIGVRNCREMVCKGCESGKTSVIFLPCRHFCCCRDCGVVLDSCPVCGAPKKAAIEALI